MVANEDVIYKTFGAKIRRTEADGEITARVSTIRVDREGDVLLPSGVDTTDFRGTMLLNHDGGKLPIGKWTSVVKKSDSIIAHGSFARRPPQHPSTVEWLPDTIKWLVSEEVLNGTSVGFLIKNSRPASAKDIERFGEDARRVVAQWPLIEISIVPVGCNPDALITAVGKTGLKDSMLFNLWGITKKNLRKSRPLQLAFPKKLVLDIPKPLVLSG